MREQLKVFYNQNANTPLFRQLVDAKAKEIENDSGEKINIEFLLSMISKGYIDENYGDYVTSSYKGLFKKNEFLFLNNLKNNIKPYFNLDVERVEVVIDEIKDYQWASSSILNNHILTYIILNGLSEQLSAFVQAVRNYYNDYNENDFIESYINTITERECLHKIETTLFGEIEKILLSDSPKTIKLNLLLAFFGEKSGPLFCRMLDYCSVSRLEEYGIVIKDFLIEQKAVLNYTVDSATRSDSLKERLNKIDFECGKLSDYKESVLNFLIENAFFVISKTNLDFILANQDEFQPREYYDYVRKHEKIKNKVMRKTQIDGFVKLLLEDKEIRISQEGIIDLLFSNVFLSDLDKTEQIVNKLALEYVDLTYSSKVYRNEIGFLPDFSSGTVRCLIQHNKVKIDFNNLLYVSHLGSVEDVVFFAKRTLEREKNKHVKIDQYAGSAFLKPFYCLLITDSNVDLDLFYEFSCFLINQKIDIIGLVPLEIIKANNVSTEKMLDLLELSLSRNSIRDSSVDAFLKLVKNNFEYFSKRFKIYRDRYKDNWFMNMAYLLKNENWDKSLKDCSLNESQISSLMKQVSPDDFAKIMKIWIGLYGIEDSSKIVEKILDKERLSIWNDTFGTDAIKNFLGNYNYSFDDRVAGKIKNNLDEICYKRDAYLKENSETKSSLIKIANNFGFGKRAVVDYSAKTESGQEMIELLKGPSLDRIKLDDKMKKFSDESQKTKLQTVYNDMFIIGRYFYKAMDRGAYDVSAFLSFWSNHYLRHDSDYLLIGAVFESYFDRGRLKTSQKKMHFDDLIKTLEQSRYERGIRFIRESLMLYKERFIYIPGDEEVAFEIVYNKRAYGEIVGSIECNHVDILADYSESDLRLSHEVVKVFDNVSIQELKYMIRNYFTIPEYRIALYQPDNAKELIPHYISFGKRKMFRPLEEIVREVRFSKGNGWGKRRL